MTIQLVTTIQRFTGLSTDTKPSDCPIGSTFYETDTGDTYIFDSTNWNIRK
jgi:hypothetical protein